MKLEDMDVVYLVKKTEINEELTYSVRSVLENMPFRNLVFVSGCPSNLAPDILLRVRQNHYTKYDNTHKMLLAACYCNAISDDFVLFNDDFFVMKPIDKIDYHYYKTLGERVCVLNSVFPHTPGYRNRLNDAAIYLSMNGCEEKNYELHMPMVINKQKMIETYRQFPNAGAVRSLYGNYHKVGGIEVEDCKLYELDAKPTGDETFLSSMDKTFHKGEVGKYIKSKFQKKSEYEID